MIYPVQLPGFSCIRGHLGSATAIRSPLCHPLHLSRQKAGTSSCRYPNMSYSFSCISLHAFLISTPASKDKQVIPNSCPCLTPPVCTSQPNWRRHPSALHSMAQPNPVGMLYRKEGIHGELNRPCHLVQISTTHRQQVQVCGSVSLGRVAPKHVHKACFSIIKALPCSRHHRKSNLR